MKVIDKIGREFSGYNILESGKRLFDRKPLQCSLYVTDRCNLDCAYCTEYDNSRESCTRRTARAEPWVGCGTLK